MKQFNIYARLSGSFGGATYQYTSLYETEEEASKEAFQIACDEYESHEGYHGLIDWEGAIDLYCEDNGINREDFEDNYENSLEVEEYYSEARESWIEYWAVPTDKDNIDQEDLVLDYIIEDDSSSQADSE